MHAETRNTATTAPHQKPFNMSTSYTHNPAEMIDKEKQNILSNWVKSARSTLAVKRIHMSSETTHVLAHADVLEDDHGSTTYNSDFNRR